MALSYPQKMRLMEHFLPEFRLRLADKAADVLPAQGLLYEGTEPVMQSLLGSLGCRPDPGYSGPPSPSALGMVLLLDADAQGLVRLRVSGQFDLVHRYIPSLEAMRQALITAPGGGAPAATQKLEPAFRRYTVTFEDAVIEVCAQDLGCWVEGSELEAALADARARCLDDERVFRRCHTNDYGKPILGLPWIDAAMTSQAALNGAVYRALFANGAEVLPYAVGLRVRLRALPAHFVNAGGRFLAEVYLENRTVRDAARAFGIDRPSLLDARLRVALDRGTHHPVPHRLQPEDYRYLDEDGLVGYGVTCAVERIGPNVFATNTLPTTAQPRVEAPGAEEVGMRARPTYAALAADPLPVLESFVDALRRYRGEWQQRLAELDPLQQVAEIQIVGREREDFERELARIEDGVALLRTHERLRTCFRWMNEVMGKAIALQGKSFDGWHLFQIGFILTQVRSVFERHAPEAERKGSEELVDVLWFATGGGKTEAYLGIIAFAMLYARTCGRGYGCTAWMRFPLRMLSVQQFQRLSYVVAQANRLRQREGLAGHPFTIGYFTGEGTPNNISRNADIDAHRGFLPNLTDMQLAAYQFIADCPYCGTERSIQMERDYARARLKHVCGNPDCWSNRDALPGEHGEGLRGEIGIFVSDEECYRYLPTVMVGTIDKLAVIGHNQRFAGFFGAARHFCPAHGFSVSPTCRHRRIVKTDRGYEAVACGNNSRTSVVRTVPMAAMPDPGFELLIQDELHLLRESLGNFDAHYETLLAALQTGFGGRSPKVLAATATIKDYDNHVHNLYLKRAMRFPAPGARRGESFYARRVVDRDSGTPLVRRWFAGLLPIGRGDASMRATAEIASRYLDQVDDWCGRLRERDTALLTALGLGAARAEEALAQLEKNFNTALIYVNRKRSIAEVLRFMEEANARRGVERGHRQLDGETTLEKILGAIQHVERKHADDPTRLLIATNVVSHGVDIAELNFMVLAGWPRSTSEYIQASARSGRVHPGIVISVLSPYKLFESGVFLNFDDYHFFLDKLVESVPINRFAPNLLNRTLPGVMSAVIFNWAPYQVGWGGELDRTARKLSETLKGSAGAARAGIEEMVRRALAVPETVESAFDRRVMDDFRASLELKVKGALKHLEHLSAGKMDQTVTEALGDFFGSEPMRSFRDIENQIQIKPVNEAAERILDALGR